MMASEKRILESLNFDLPEIIILNFGDPKVSYKSMTNQVRKDSWLHSFGIIGLYDGSTQNEQELIEEMKDLNVLVMLDYSRIASHIVKSVKIISENWQLIYQKDLYSHFMEHSSGSFSIDNDILAISIYAGIAVTNLVQKGFLKPENKMHLQLALSELIVNGIEHGHCGISFGEKTEFLQSGRSVIDLVSEKCKDPVIAAKRVHFEWDSSLERTIFNIRDEGEGFDISKIKQKVKNDDPLSQHGRGIIMAEAFTETVEYNEIVNEVKTTVKHDDSVIKDTPEGFSDEEVIYPKKGDVVFKEGEKGNFLYYIASGRYQVLHNKKVVGSLSPVDLFMGEMAFLLNNRRSAAVVAEEAGKLIKISRKSFVQVMKKYPHYGIFLSKLLARKIVRANEQHSAKEL
ncbi:MAG: cyclic nucleotide-binding domain-containing protein, partial [Spirochaetota bacterium]|nr:cyclic nucleotide-binding domain-containing protein [Spirochaetota bacterium]